MCSSDLGGILDLTLARLPAARTERDVVRYRGAEEERLLGHESNGAAQHSERQPTHVDAVNEDGARRWIVQARQQVQHLQTEIAARVEAGDRVLVTTLTKRMAEDLTEFYAEAGVRVRYLHSDIDTLERIELLRDLRLGEFDVLVGINLLREGLDLPEVGLVGILDADKEGFLRSERSLIQTIGRAARNAQGRVILYADKMTDSMRQALDETNRRRHKQQTYNETHGITPRTVQRSIKQITPPSQNESDSQAERQSERYENSRIAHEDLFERPGKELEGNCRVEVSI